MVREFCDRCKAEIPSEERNKRILQISYEIGYRRTECASITLCPKCFSEMGISKATNDVGLSERRQKEPNAVEKLMDIFRELINECME